MAIRQNVFASVFAFTALLIGYLPNASGTCRWDGTAPYCAGECGIGETEEARASAAHMVTHLPSENHFGNGCVFGTKAYCCKTPGVTCRWDGTAPFCEGECEADEKEVQRCGSCIGKVCWTGSKAKCCKSQAGSAGQSLTAGAKHARYAAIWEKKSGPAWVARHGLTSAEYQEQFTKLGKQGYRLVYVSGYDIGGKDHYAAIWEKKSGPAWVARHGLTAAEYQEEFTKLGKQGYRLAHINGYSVGGKVRYAAIWEKKPGPAWEARHGLTSAEYQQVFNELGKKNYRLVHVNGYGVGGKVRYAAIWEKKSGPAWMARQGMTSAGYQEEFNYLAKDGYRLSLVSGYYAY